MLFLIAPQMFFNFFLRMTLMIIITNHNDTLRMTSAILMTFISDIEQLCNKPDPLLVEVEIAISEVLCFQ